MNSPRAPFTLGFEAYRREDYQAAAAHFEAVLRDNPRAAPVLGFLGMARMRGGDLEGARSSLTEAEALCPSPESAFRLGLLELSEEHFEEALSAFEDAGKRGFDALEVSIGEASCLALMGEGAEAREILEPLVEEEDPHDEVLYWFAVACAQDRDRAGLRGQAVDRLRQLVERGEEVSRWLRGRAHFLLASLLDDHPECYQEAVEHYQAGLSHDPDFVVGRNNLGAVYLSQGEPEKARRELLQALALQPGYRRVHGNLARLYYDKLEEDELREDLARLTGELPPEKLPEAVFGLMVALMDEARLRAAQEFYDRGHALKNLLALTGTRIKRLQRRLPEGEELVEGLDSLKSQYDEVYSRLVGDLRLVRPPALRGERIDVNGLLRKLARRVAREVGEELEVHLDLSRGLPILFGDSAAFSEALLNLARNASEAMEGRGSLELGSRLLPGGDRIEVRIRDSGPGLPPGSEERLFRSGYTTKETGSGLGLALVRRTLRDLHGSVHAENHPEGGACFVLLVPVEVRYHPTRGLGLAARPVRMDEWNELNVDELA